MKAVKKLMDAQDKCGLLTGQGRDFTIKEHEIGQVKDFIRMVFCNGTITESYVDSGGSRLPPLPLER